ncbi:MAG: hypothetical protein QXQ40_02145 [Candidatus Aenigmatarchaeota archaeon]
MRLNIIKALEDGYDTLCKKSAILYLAGVIAFMNISSVYFINNFFPMKDITEGNMLSYFIPFVTIFLIICLIEMFLTGMIIKIASEPGKKVSLDKTADFIAKKYLKLVIGSILYYILIISGFILFLIPGIFLMIKLMFYQYAIIIHNKRVLNSFETSWNITKRNWWQIFAFTLIVLLVSLVFYFISVLASVISSEIEYILMFFITLFIVSWSASSFTMAYKQLTSKK